jgi:Uma2 family endonuclease
MATEIETLTWERTLLWFMKSDQFAALPEECEQKLELLGGRVFMAAKPRISHQQFMGRLFSALDSWARTQGLGRVYPEVEVRLDEDWSPAPDIAFVATANLGRIHDTHIEGPVDLAVEILSPSNTGTDRRDKFDAYARYGIPWYWIVDLDGRVLEEYEAAGGVYARRDDHPFDRPFTPRLFPGLSLDLAAIL